MPRYSFYLQDGSREDHALELVDDSAAVGEALKTASGMLLELKPPESRTATQLLEVRNGGDSQLFRIEIHATRGR